MQKVEFPSINSRERHPCGGINLCRCNTLKRKVLLGGDPRRILKKKLTKRYYAKKIKGFFELKMGSMTINEYERRFLELPKYVSFIKDETVKYPKVFEWISIIYQ